jgi:hypothetical protein
MAMIWLKPPGLFIYPPHKWDGNELNYFFAFNSSLPLVETNGWKAFESMALA